jgi:hypothetical protein
MGFKPKNTIYHQTVDIVIANSLTLAVVQITKNLVKKKGRMAQIILVSHQVIQPLPSPMPPYSFKNTKILTCGMPVVGLYLQQPPLSCALPITSIIHLISRSRNWITVGNFSD